MEATWRYQSSLGDQGSWPEPWTSNPERFTGTFSVVFCNWSGVLLLSHHFSFKASSQNSWACIWYYKVRGPLPPLSPLDWKSQRQRDGFPLPVGVVSEFIACCALCGRNFFFISQRTACLIIKALSIAWYNSDNVSLQLNAQYNYVFEKQSFSSC